MRAPYPVELVPLFPEFLTKRRTKFTFPLRLTEELGIDRPALFFVVGGVAPQGGGRYSEMWNPYATQWDQHQAASAAARDAGLVDEKDGRWDLTPKARELMKRFRREADAYLAALPSPLSMDDLSRLAAHLGRAFEATAASLDRRWHSHIPRAARMAGDANAHPMIALENAVFGLWQARDDCHMAAWQQAGRCSRSGAGPVMSSIPSCGCSSNHPGVTISPRQINGIAELSCFNAKPNRKSSDLAGIGVRGRMPIRRPGWALPTERETSSTG